MKYDNMGDPADVEAADRWIEKAGYGYALKPIREHIVELEAVANAARVLVLEIQAGCRVAELNAWDFESWCTGVVLSLAGDASNALDKLDRRGDG